MFLKKKKKIYKKHANFKKIEVFSHIFNMSFFIFVELYMVTVIALHTIF